MPASARPNTGLISGWDDGDTYGTQANASLALIDSLLFPNVVHARAHGAKGDGATDDTAAVLSAISAVPANGRLHFANGTYLLSTWTVQTLAKVIWLSGDGMGQTIIKGTSGASFLSVTANFKCSGVTFDTWSTTINFSSVSTVLDQVRIEDIEIKNYNRGIYGNSATAGVGLRRFVVQGCHFTTSTSYAIFINLDIIDRARITKNTIKNCVQHAISLGNNTLVFADDRGSYLVDGNLIDGVTGPSPGSAVEGIDCIGWRAMIVDNEIRNVSRGAPTDSDANGIFTKCRYSVISNNLLVDAGQTEAFINVKGGARNETVIQPYGFSVIVANNMLLDTQSNPTLGGGGKKTSGIKIATSEVLVANNIFQGFTNEAITSDSDVGSDSPVHNIVITGNTIKDHRGYSAITLFGRGNRIRLLDNLIDTVDGSYDTTAQNFGIKIAKKEGIGLDIIGNRIYNVVDTGHTPVGIQLNPGTLTNVITADPATDTLTTAAAHTLSVDDRLQFVNSGGGLPGGISAATTYYVKAVPTGTTFTISATLGGATLDITSAGTGTNTAYKLTTLSAWRVADNDVQTARYGIQFTWDETYITVDDVLVSLNTGRNINGLNPPLVVDLVKYSDTPTNLVDLPASQTAAVFYETSNKAATRSGTSPQDYRLYNTFTDASNYERMTIQAKSTATDLMQEFAGTGIARVIRFGIGGTIFWRLATGGHWQPEADNLYDIGGVSTRARSLFLSQKLYLPYVNTATVGAVTINEVSGRVNAAAASTSLVVTNSRVTAASHVFCVCSTNDTTARVTAVVPAAGSFTIFYVAPTAQSSIDFVVFNAD